MKKKEPNDFAMDLLQLVVRRISYFEQNPTHLAWVMMHYAALLHCGRILFDDWTNPKDAILDIKEVTQAQQDLIYDAWGVTVSNYSEFNDAALPLERKLCKTMNEWLDLLLDPRYRYNSIYPNRLAVCDYLLCAIGTGMKWVKKDGVSYIANVGPAGTNKALFAGYTAAKEKVDPEIRAAVLKISDRFGCLRYIEQAIDNGRKAAKGWQWEPRKEGCVLVPSRRTQMALFIKKLNSLRFPEGSNDLKPRRKRYIRREYYHMSAEYSNLLNMPRNAHPSYWHAGLRILSEILLSPASSDDNIRLAWNFYKKAPYAHWHPKALLGHLSKRPGPLPTMQDLERPVYKVGDWVVESQNHQPETGIVKRMARSLRPPGEAGKGLPQWFWEVDVDVYSCAGIKLKTIQRSHQGHWLKIRPLKFPIRPDDRGQWHKAVTVIYYPYPVPKNTVERWLLIKTKKKAKA